MSLQPGFVDVTGIDPSTPVNIDGTQDGSGAKKYSLAAGRRSVTLGDVTTVVSIRPGKTLSMHKKSAAEASTEPSSSGRVEVPVLVGYSEVPGLVAPARLERNRTLMYSGIGVAAAGVVTLGIGGVFGVVALNQSAHANESGTSQLAAVAAHNSARNDALGANVCYVVGGVAVLAGALLFGSSWAFPTHVTAGASD